MDPEILDMARAEAGESMDRIERNLLALEDGSTDQREAIDALFRDAHSIKGTAGMVGWEDASSIAHAMEDRLEECRESGEFPVELASPLLRATDALRRAVAGDAVEPGEAIAELGNGRPEDGGAQAPGPGPASAVGRAIRVDAEKVDRMLDAVGETVLHHRRLDHQLSERIIGAGDEVAAEELDLGEHLLEELQDSVIEMRTMPLSSIIAPFPRAVRDLATAEGKDVELLISGAETQLDRVILEGISEPITHLLRNAVAHGVEPPAERERVGKPGRARVELRAEQREGMVAIEVSDDGRGVSTTLLRRADEAGSLADVLAEAGFSTAAEVSEVAGRGVGLDAVKAHVEGLGGSLEVVSEPERGATVTMLLPVTLALLEVLLCERGGRVFGVALTAVREVIAVAETASLGGRRSIELRGKSVPVGDLAVMLGAAAAPLPPVPVALVLASAGRSVAVACDRILGDQEVVVKALGPLLAGVRGYLGAAILGDGRVALILDPNHLLKMPSPGAAPRSQVAKQAEPAAPRLLVVDDQFTVRELQRSILETAGYSVETARDGNEALDRIGAAPDVDLVLTDIQMPGIDGFELLRRIREDPERSSLPVVVVSAQGSAADRRRGVEEGADAYIVKEEFDQQVLLETIARLVGR
jgi:two-component system, chemotaxis family, sensor kinase CheA